MFEYKESDLFKTGADPIEFDKSSDSEVYRQFSITEGPTAGGVGESSYYNGKDVNFHISFSDNYRIALYKSFIRVEGHAAVYTPGVGESVVPLLNTGIAWNSYAALIDTARIRFNDSNTDTEELTQNFGHSNMMKALLTQSRDAIESMQDVYFTPCIEIKRDTAGGMSQTTIDRCAKNLRTAAGGIQYHSKNLYLSDIFDSLRIATLTRYKKLQLTMRFKNRDGILFSDAGAVSNYYVTGITMYLAMYKLAPSQLIEELGRTTTGLGNFRESFWAFDTVQNPAAGSFTYKESTVKNMMASIVVVPSTLADDGIGVNQYQYCYGSAIGGVTGITDYEFTYNQVTSPDSKIQVSNTNRSLNTVLYSHYRQLARRVNDREFPIAIPFDSFSTQNAAGPDDICPYVLFCAQFYPFNDRLHKLMGGAEFETTVTTGSRATFLIIKIRFSCYEAKNDYTITVLR